MSNKEAIGRYWKRACEKLYVLQILGLYGALGMMSFPSPFAAPLRVPGPACRLQIALGCQAMPVCSVADAQTAIVCAPAFVSGELLSYCL